MSNNYEPELHSCGQSSPYIDPDYGALLSTDQLPSLSTIGRGPRGFGLFANANETTDGYFTFDIVSDVTGESILTSPNLHSGVISVKQRPDDLVPGASSFLDITVTRGKDVATYEVELPSGSDGGRVYLWDGTKEKHPSWTYRIPTDELHFDGEAVWPSKPDPRPNDIVMMTIKDAHKYYLAVAHVVGNVGLDTIVTATTFCPVPIPYIGDNGHWYVDGEDTGVEAQGPKGDKAQMRIGTVTTLVPGKQAEASIALVDEEDNIYELSLKIPEGNVGRSVDIQPGVYTEATLPAFHLTPINTAYIVDDSDGRFDLYIRCHEAAGDAQWTILENWEGKPATIGDVAVVHLKQNEEAYAEVSWSTTPEANRYDINLFLPLDPVPGSITTELIADGAITYDKIADKGVTLSKLGDDVLARIDINDDVLEFANLAAFPATGETGKIYIATDTNKMYRWSGAGYAEISSSLVSATGCANALIGTESGDGVYVDDAWPANAVRMVISGKSVQDGTPTPGTPVPIINVASPVQIMIPDNISG